MNLLLNIIWLICGGFLICVEYIVSSLLLMITIVGIPFGFQTLKLSMLALCPFGREIRSCPGDGGCLSVLMNIIWILVGGIWISLSHLAFGVFCFASLSSAFHSDCNISSWRAWHLLLSERRLYNKYNTDMIVWSLWIKCSVLRAFVTA